MILRSLFISFVVLVAIYLFLQGRTINRSSEKPVFLRADKIAENHQTKIDITVESQVIPDSLELVTLEKDYANIWAHLNHLYATNDIIAGKEYYTESWFKQLAASYDGVIEPVISRKDEYHHFYIKNWSNDGLVCSAIDSNAVLTYIYPNEEKESYKLHMAIVLLYQGDHWRIDAIKVIDNNPHLIE